MVEDKMQATLIDKIVKLDQIVWSSPQAHNRASQRLQQLRAIKTSKKA